MTMRGSGCGPRSAPIRKTRVLYNAAIDYEAAHLIGRAIQVRQVLLRNFPHSMLASRATYLIASNYHALAVYMNAAEWYERFARENPAAELPLSRFLDPRSGAPRAACTDEERSDPGLCAVARSALENAVFFRVALGESAAASEAATLYAEGYRESHAQDAARVVFSTRPRVAPDMPIDDPAAIEAFHTAFLADFSGVMPIEVEARSQVELGLALLALERRAEAASAFDRVTALVTDAALDALPDDETRIVARVRAREAAEEALVRRADLDALELPRVPAVSGAHTAAGLRRWAESALARWVTRAAAAVAERERAYAAAREGAISGWGIAARERIGSLYHQALMQGREVAVPAWATDDELALALEDAIDGALRPLREGALRHYGDCERHAQLVRWFSEDADRCSAGLDALDRRRANDELVGGGEHVPDAPVPPLPVFHVGASSNDD